LNWKLIFFASLIAYGAYQHLSQRPVSHKTEGVVAALQPIQQSTSQSKFVRDDYIITPLESFELEARILSTEHYSFDREADLSPVDLALGWGRMSDESILKDIDIKQSGRFYYWHVNEFPIPREEIETHSANMHMIPANSQIEAQLKSARVGQIVAFKGQLVEVKANDGWHWKSSLTREDTGNGACEVIYVKTLSVT
jgi:hypothetical protein